MYAHRLSITELLERSSTGYSNLFPQIDTTKYQANAPYSLYEEDGVNASQEILAYFGTPIENTVQTPFASIECLTIKGCEAPNPSITSRRTSIISAEFELKSCMLKNNKEDALDAVSKTSTATRKPSCRRYSIPVIIVGSALGPPPVDDVQTQFGPSVWFGCTMEYQIVSGQLKVNMQRVGTLLSELTLKKKGSMYAKLCLLPGNKQKQRVQILSNDGDNMTLPCVHFRNCPLSEMSQKSISVKIYLRRGLLKKPYIVHTWTVSLSSVSVSERLTAWKRVEGLM